MQPDLIITLGDLIDDAKDGHEWDRVMNMMATLDAPVVYTAGNHDIVDAESEARFKQYTGHNSYRSFDVEGWHFVIVDNAIGESWEELDFSGEFDDVRYYNFGPSGDVTTEVSRTLTDDHCEARA